MLIVILSSLIVLCYFFREQISFCHQLILIMFTQRNYCAWAGFHLLLICARCKNNITKRELTCVATVSTLVLLLSTMSLQDFRDHVFPHFPDLCCFVACSKFCFFGLSPKPCFANRLYELDIFLCPSCLQSTLWVSYFLNSLSCVPYKFQLSFSVTKYKYPFGLYKNSLLLTCSVHDILSIIL